jgi:thiol-disulfide isomerase/thioredoxin
MSQKALRKRVPGHSPGWLFAWWILAASWAIFPSQTRATLLENRFPGLSGGVLKSAILTPMDEKTLLIADGGIVIRQSDIQKIIESEDPHLRIKAGENQVFLLEREATDRLVFIEAKKAGISVENGDAEKAVQTFLETQAEGASVSEAEALAFYQHSKEILGEVPFEMIRDNIREYLLQEAKQAEIQNYIIGLGETKRLRVNEKWVEVHSRLTLDNPLDRARGSGKPTLAEFGASSCDACDRMEAILENLRKEYLRSLNIVAIHVEEAHFLAARYGIGAIPVQVFFDAQGQEVFRHVGFFPQAEVARRLDEIGVKKRVTLGGIDVRPVFLDY